MAYLDITLGTIQTPSIGGVSASCPIDTDKIALFYGDSTSARSVIYTLSGVTLTPGDEDTISSSDIRAGTSVACCKLDTDKFLVSYCEVTSDDLEMRVVTVSGTDATPGAEVELTAQRSSDMALCQIDTDVAVLVAYDNTPQISVRLITVADTTPSQADVEVFANVFDPTGGTDNHRISVCKVDTNKFVVFYRADNALLYARVCTISGTSLTIGDVQIVSNDYSAYYCTEMSVASYGTGKVVFSYIKDDVASSGFESAFARAGTISGTTITFGTEKKLYEGTTNTPRINACNCCSTGDDKVVFGYNVNDNTKRFLVAGTISGTTITIGTAKQFNATVTTVGGFLSAVESSGDKVFLSFNDDGTSNGFAGVGSVDYSLNVPSNFFAVL